MKIIKIIILIFFVSFLFNGKVEKTKEELKKTKDLITEKIVTKDRYVKKETDISKELKKLDLEIKKIDMEEQSLKQKIDNIEKRLIVISNQIEILNNDIEFYRKFLGIELNRYVLEHVIQTPFYEDNMIKKIKKLAIKQRYEELQNIKLKQEYNIKISKEYTKQKSELEKYKNDLVQKRKQQSDLFIKKNDLLTQLRRDKVKIEQEIEQLKKTQNSLEDLLKKLQRQQQQQQRQTTIRAIDLPVIDRKFPKPVVGEIVNRFGKEKNVKEDTAIIRNGVTFQSMADIDIFVVESGKVIFVSNNFRSYGKMVIIEHKDEVYSVYGQLGEILVSEGQKVLKKQVIGKTNSFGQVYFELRKNLIPVNPELYFE